MGKTIKRHLSMMIFFIFILIVLIIFVVIGQSRKCNISINYGLNESSESLKHNYILFVDKGGNVHGKLVETNGYIVLEAVLKKSLKINSSQQFNDIVKSFGYHKLTGWWPEEVMRKGKYYFNIKEPVKLYYDPDDTAMIYRYYDNIVDEDVLKAFLSDESLPSPFHETCIKIGCEKQYIVREWSNKDWHEDIDIVTVADFITVLDLNSPLAKTVFETNKKLINYVIENDEIDRYFKYFEPKSTAYFLLLYYDDKGPQYLNGNARNILLQRFEETSHEMEGRPIVARWGGGGDWFYGCNIVTMNDNIPKLMQQYSKQYWNI